MIEALILILLIAGIVAASRRWPDIEKRIFGEHGFIPHHETAEPPRSKTDTTPSTTTATPNPAPLSAEEPSAGGFMRRREISSEPDVDPTVMNPGAAENDAIEEPTEPESTPETPAEPESQPTPETDQLPDAKPAAPDTPAVTAEPASPGGHVTGTPAMPSEPAYVDATASRKINESVDELARIADQAYRDREYEKAENACLKILMQEPKNHKYMTRIGQVYQEMGQLEDAKEAFEAAKSLDPKNFFVLNRLAEVERQISDKGGRTKSKS